MKRMKNLFVVGAAVLSMTLASVTLPSTADARGGRGGGIGGGARMGGGGMRMGGGARMGGMRAAGGMRAGRGAFGRAGRGFGRAGRGFARGGIGRGFRGGRFGFRLGFGRRLGLRACPYRFRLIRGRCRRVF